MMKMIEKHGITLIALVITIIVLVILAGISINLILGDNGIIQRTKYASSEYDKQAATEKINLKITNIQISSYAKRGELPNLQYLADNLCEDEEMEYVALETKKTASLQPITVGEATSIFTKLKEYPYEFEINNSLQLASIDGIKIATSNDNEEITISVKDLKTLISDEVKAQLNANPSVPAGTVISYMGNNEPSGYLFCNGATYNISDYPNLAEQIKSEFGSYNYYGGDGTTTFAVPNLQGEFLRGTGTNSYANQGNGTTVGKHQDATEIPAYYQETASNTVSYRFDDGNLGDNQDYVMKNFEKIVKANGTVKMIQFAGGKVYNSSMSGASFNVRPTNTSVLYCIKY